MSCNKDKGPEPIKLTTASVNLFTGVDHQIEYSGDDPVTFLSMNDFVAEVSASGMITANKVGTTEIKVSNSANSQSFSVTVDPRYNLFREPITDWSLTRSEIILRLGTPLSGTDDGILYISPGSVEADYEMYLFDSNNKLTSSAVTGSSSHLVDVSVHLLERYQLIEDPDYLLFVNNTTVESSTLSVILDYLNFSEYLALYISSTQVKSVQHDKFQQLIKSH